MLLFKYQPPTYVLLGKTCFTKTYILYPKQKAICRRIHLPNVVVNVS